ncbi:hypothetical protein As57867_006814, partial [Aphanomyces stellatus]
DLGRLLPNGRFEIVGRQDSQVKLKGYRIELDEVAHAMLQHPGVVAAAAIVQDKTHLVGFFSPATVTVEALQATVALHLPVYMVPAAWVGLDALPENANGKIDKHALGRLDQDTVDVQPLATAIETRLAAAWAHVLGIELDTIGRRASFLALGGDSITAIRLVAKAKQAGLAITSANVMKHPMLQQMAHTATPIVVARDAAPVAGSVPLTPIQHWILNLPWQNVHFWNLSLVKQARGLTFDQVHNAVARLQGHHDMLRARFSVDAGTWSQVVLEASDAANVAFVDLPDNLADVMAQTERSLHLFHGPVYAVTVYSVPDSTTQVLQLSLHHAIVDLVSWRILLEDLQLLLVDSQASLGPKTTSFQAWSQALSRQALVWDPRGWDAYMGNDVVPPPDRRGERLHRERVALGATARLVAANATYGTNIQELALVALTGAWRDMLANAGDNDRKLLLTMEGHGRDAWTSDLDVSSTVGWFTCDYPVVLHATASLPDLVCQIKQTLRAVPDKGLSYGAIKHLAPPSTSTHAIQTHQRHHFAFNYLGRFQEMDARDTVLGSLDHSLPQHESTDGACLPGSLELFHDRDELVLELVAPDWLLPSNNVRCWGLFWRDWMTRVVDHCLDPTTIGGRTLSDVSLLKSSTVLADVEREMLRTLQLRPTAIEDIFPV